MEKRQPGQAGHPQTLQTIQRRKAMVMRLRPLLMLAVLIPAVSFMMYPMVNMQPRDIHVGIVNLDKGASFEQGEVNLGDKLTDTILHPDGDDSDDPKAGADVANANDSKSGSDATEADAGTPGSNADTADTDASNDDTDSPLVWVQYDSEEAARAAMDRHDLYGYLVIPRKFSKTQTAQLKAFNKLSEALGTMQDGTGKLKTAFGKMGSRMGALPDAFGNLETATAGLRDAADGLQKAADMMGTESGEISEALTQLQSDQMTTGLALAQAQQAIAALTEKEAGEITMEDLQAVQEILDDAGQQTSAEHMMTIGKNAAIIAAQSSAASQGLEKISAAEAAMSENFSTISDKMGGVGSGVRKMSKAIGGISKGLGKMSENMDEKVSDAIDAINDTETDDAEDEEETDDTGLRFTIDQSRNVMVSTTLTSVAGGMAAGSGMAIDIDYANEIPDDLNNMYFVMVFMMMTMFASMITGILSGLLSRSDASAGQRAKTVAFQLPLAAAIAVTAGLVLPRGVQWMTGTSLPIDDLSHFIAICAFGLLLLIIGAIDLFGMPGAAVPGIIMLCGTAVANLPYEYLPAFWQQYVYPWEPLRFIADGIRTMLYWNGSWWNAFSRDMLGLAAIGAALMVLSILRKLLGTRRKEHLPQDGIPA